MVTLKAEHRDELHYVPRKRVQPDANYRLDKIEPPRSTQGLRQRNCEDRPEQPEMAFSAQILSYSLFLQVKMKPELGTSPFG
jgi:hypothetical protein